MCTDSRRLDRRVVVAAVVLDKSGLGLHFHRYVRVRPAPRLT